MPLSAAQDKFDNIIEAAIANASNVPCDVETYIEGLESMIETLKIELQAAREMQGDS